MANTQLTELEQRKAQLEARIRRLRQAQAQRKKEVIYRLLDRHGLTELELAEIDALLGRLKPPASPSAPGESGSARTTGVRG